MCVDVDAIASESYMHVRLCRCNVPLQVISQLPPPLQQRVDMMYATGRIKPGDLDNKILLQITEFGACVGVCWCVSGCGLLCGYVVITKDTARSPTHMCTALLWCTRRGVDKCGSHYLTEPAHTIAVFGAVWMSRV